MSIELTHLIRALIAAPSFEEASTAVLRPMLERVREAAAARYAPGKARILRGMVHLRPRGGYRGLTVLELEDDPTAVARTDAAFIPSASAWRWVETHRCAVSLDVSLAMIQPLESAAAAFVDDHMSGGAFGSDESQRRLLSRSATHVCLLPLRTAGGSIDGAISLEVECRAAMGTPFVWPECLEALQLLADVAAPHLLILPLKPGVVGAIDDLLPVVGSSMAPIIRALGVFAQQEETILLYGPTGSGKSRLARWCHERSRRRTQPFEVVDLQTVPEELQMAELFGWKKGAFTGALSDNPGNVARASGGTLFIDEIDKLSLRAQAGLLHLLEDRRYRVLGDSTTFRQADVRFIVGTNVDLSDAVSQGRFREDLFYRINVLPVRVPALRERSDELPAWAQYMLERRHRECGGEGRASLAAEAGLRLLGLPWPGNLRQLDNVIRRAYSFALLEYGHAPGELVLRERHLEQALASEGRLGDASLTGNLRRTAAAFVEELVKRGERGGEWDLDWTDALKGFVLLAALERYDDRDEVFRRLGRDNLVKNRNHHKALRRELARVAELYQALGRALDPDIAAVIERFDAGG